MAGAKVIQPVTLKFTPSRPALYLEHSSPCLHRGPTLLTLTSVHLSPLEKGSPDHQALHTPTRHYLIFFKVSIFSWNFNFFKSVFFFLCLISGSLTPLPGRLWWWDPVLYQPHSPQFTPFWELWQKHQFSSIQLLTCVQIFVTPWTAECQASLSLLKLMTIKSVMSSSHLILCHPPLLLNSIFPSIRVFSSEWVLHIRWPKYWSFSFSISPSNEYSELISFRTDWLDLLAVQETL